jgi:hypothetical protein
MSITSAESEKGDERYKCLLCTEEVRVKGSQLRDHVGGEHFGHASHQCQTCERGFTSGKKAYKHAGVTGHVVTLNGVGALWVG